MKHTAKNTATDPSLPKQMSKIVDTPSPLGLLLCVLLIPIFLLPDRDMQIGKYSLGQWLEGRAANEIETTIIEKATPLQNLSDLFRSWRFSIFNEGSSGVIIGENGWLFSTEEFVADTNRAERLLARNLAEVITNAQHIQDQDIAVMIALLPDKSRILSEQLGHHVKSPHSQTRYEKVRAALIKAGLCAPDLRTVLAGNAAEQTFLKSDTHWTPYGSGQVAGLLAREIESLSPELLAQRHITQSRISPEPHRGDLAQFVPRAALPDGAPSGQEMLLRPKIIIHSEQQDENALFAENIPDIVLIGTSFSADTRWSFVDQLQLKLQNEVLNLAEKGKGILLPMRQLIAEGFLRKTPPKLLIWEIPERYLSRIEGK